MKKAAKKPTTRAAVKKVTVKDLSVVSRAGGIKGGRRADAWSQKSS